jgi:hypothetical protein
MDAFDEALYNVLTHKDKPKRWASRNRKRKLKNRKRVSNRKRKLPRLMPNPDLGQWALPRIFPIPQESCLPELRQCPLPRFMEALFDHMYQFHKRSLTAQTFVRRIEALKSQRERYGFFRTTVGYVSDMDNETLSRLQELFVGTRLRAYVYNAFVRLHKSGQPAPEGFPGRGCVFKCIQCLKEQETPDDKIFALELEASAWHWAGVGPNTWDKGRILAEEPEERTRKELARVLLSGKPIDSCIQVMNTEVCVCLDEEIPACRVCVREFRGRVSPLKRNWITEQDLKELERLRVLLSSSGSGSFVSRFTEYMETFSAK